MFETTLNPDFNKLRNYFPNITDTDIAHVRQAGGVPVNLEYMDETDYLRLSEGLNMALVQYGIADHHEELLYLTLQKNEQIRERYEAYWQNYNDDKLSREVAAFLLAYKTSKLHQPYELIVKTITGSTAVKSREIARWMSETIYNAIENQEFSLGLLGTKLMKGLFGDNPFSTNSISIERLTATANLKPTKPTKYTNNLSVELCLYLKVYLDLNTNLKVNENILITDAQANLLYYILKLLGYLNNEKITSEPKDYIRTIIKRHSNK